MRQIGIVSEVFDGFATVEVSRKSACEGCHAASDGGCSACISFGNKKTTARADNSIGAKIGDRVMLETDSRVVILYAAAVFSAPLVGEEKNTLCGFPATLPEVIPWRRAPVSNISFILPSSSVRMRVSPEADILKGAETPDVDDSEADIAAYSPEDILKDGKVNLNISAGSSVRCQPSRLMESSEEL